MLVVGENTSANQMFWSRGSNTIKENKKLKNRKLRYSEKQQIKDGIEEYNSTSISNYTCSNCEFFHKNQCNKESVCSEDTIYKDFRD